VSANSALRQAFIDYGKRYHWSVFIPPFSFTTDNAAMIAKVAEKLYVRKVFAPLTLGVDPNWRLDEWDKFE
jgi:N6-L-threonylcarbamoyladenine synthase